jgi:hypothetical protein
MLTLTALCHGRYFVIPRNQRGFSWGTHQVNDMLRDLELVGSQSHYMGPVIVSRTETPDFPDDQFRTTAEYLLEDGQQRVTSLLIFANELRKRLESIGGFPVHVEELRNLVFLNHHGVKLRLQNLQPPLHDYFSCILLGSPSPPADRTPPMDALDSVKAKLAEHVASLDTSALLRWKERITNQALFIFVDLRSAGAGLSRC